MTLTRSKLGSCRWGLFSFTCSAVIAIEEPCDHHLYALILGEKSNEFVKALACLLQHK